jgi:phage minor structural protein
MLTVFDGATGYPILDDKYYVRLLASGLDEIIFNISIRDPVFKCVVEEARIRDRDGNYYLVKQIDAGNESAKVIAQIDIDAFKATMFPKYTNGSATVYNTVMQVLPSGWNVIDYAAKSFKRTIPTSDAAGDYNVTAWDVLQACCDTYKVRFRFDNVRKVVYIIDPSTYLNIGAFATRDLNLKDLNYKGKSTGFITRLYAEGADGLTFASINGGKNYVDDHSYSNKVISYYWKDERYKDKQSLLDDARAKLAELAKPTRSYDCDVLDLANTNPEKYGFEDFSLFNVITLVDDAQEKRLDYQIVEKWEYPYYPVNNKVVLSTETPKIQNQVVSLIDSVNNPTSTFQQIMQSAIANSTALITGNRGGYVVFHDANGDGVPDEILVMNTPSITTATKVWRWNASGLGYSKNGYNGNYGLAMTMDGAIVADYITTGSLTANIIKAGILTDLKGKFTLDMINGTLTMKDGTFSGTVNASTIKGSTITGGTITGGTITGSTIQNAATGSRVLMDSSSSLKGYYNNTLHNIINMSNRNNTSNDLIIDADHELHIRTPKVYVSNTSYGTGGGQVYETYDNFNDGYSFVSNVDKRQSGEYFLKNVSEDEADVLCMLPVLLNVEWTNFKIRHGMMLSGASKHSSTI